MRYIKQYLPFCVVLVCLWKVIIFSEPSLANDLLLLISIAAFVWNTHLETKSAKEYSRLVEETKTLFSLHGDLSSRVDTQLNAIADLAEKQSKFSRSAEEMNQYLASQKFGSALYSRMARKKEQNP